MNYGNIGTFRCRNVHLSQNAVRKSDATHSHRRSSSKDSFFFNLLSIRSIRSYTAEITFTRSHKMPCSSTMNTFLAKDSVADRLAVMRRQEETTYNYQNYFPRSSDGEIRLNVTWREKICHWSYNVVDHFDLSREVVAVSLDLFDRFLATKENKCSGNLALLVSLTTLHLAIKVHDSKKIKITTLANLSRGQFGPAHIEEMELKVLSALGWKLHPPTQYAFISHMLLFLPNEAHPSVRKEIFEMSRYLTELAVCDSWFVDCNKSTVAFAAILNVMEDITYSRLSAGIREKFLRELCDSANLSHRSPTVIAARDRLKAMFTSAVASGGEDFVMADTTFAPHCASKTVADMDSASLSSSGSTVSHRGRTNSCESNGRFMVATSNRARTNSGDSFGSCRYSPSPRRRCVVSPIGPTTRSNRLSSSPIVAGVQ